MPRFHANLASAAVAALLGASAHAQAPGADAPARPVPPAEERAYLWFDPIIDLRAAIVGRWRGSASTPAATRRRSAAAAKATAVCEVARSPRPGATALTAALALRHAQNYGCTHVALGIQYATMTAPSIHV